MDYTPPSDLRRYLRYYPHPRNHETDLRPSRLHLGTRPNVLEVFVVASKQWTRYQGREREGGALSHILYTIYIISIQFRFYIDKNRPELKTSDLWISRSMLDLLFLLILSLRSLDCILENVNQSVLIVEFEQPIRSLEILKLCTRENSHWSESSREIQKEGKRAD